jgi:hypothetical protein
VGKDIMEEALEGCAIKDLKELVYMCKHILMQDSLAIHCWVLGNTKTFILGQNLAKIIFPLVTDLEI